MLKSTNTATFSVIDGVLLKPLAYREPDRLISLHLRITTLKNLGIAAGCVGALFLMRSLSTMLYGVGSGDAATYSISGALILVVAGASSWLPALRATRLDPVETIRCE